MFYDQGEKCLDGKAFVVGECLQTEKANPPYHTTIHAGSNKKTRRRFPQCFAHTGRRGGNPQFNSGDKNICPTPTSSSSSPDFIVGKNQICPVVVSASAPTCVDRHNLQSHASLRPCDRHTPEFPQRYIPFQENNLFLKNVRVFSPNQVLAKMHLKSRGGQFLFAQELFSAENTVKVWTRKGGKCRRGEYSSWDISPYMHCLLALCGYGRGEGKRTVAGLY